MCSRSLWSDCVDVCTGNQMKPFANFIYMQAMCEYEIQGEASARTQLCIKYVYTQLEPCPDKKTNDRNNSSGQQQTKPLAQKRGRDTDTKTHTHTDTDTRTTRNASEMRLAK